MIGDGKPFHSRRWLGMRVRAENRLGRKLKHIGDRLQRDASLLVEHAVIEYHKANK